MLQSRIIQGSVACIVLLSACLSVASANDELVALYRPAVEKSSADLRASEDLLRGKPEDDWQIADLQRYLVSAFDAVYMAKAISNYSSSANADATNNDLTKVVEQGFLESWPLNPFNKWEPMRVLKPTDPFSPGDLVLQLCPNEYFTGYEGRLLPISFALYIYGETPEYASFGDISTQTWNDNEYWVHAPSGAMYGTDFYMTSKKTYERRKAKRQKQQSIGRPQVVTPPD